MRLTQATVCWVIGIVCLGISTSKACPFTDRTLKDTDDRLWADVRAKGDPARWVKYCVSTGCNKEQAQDLIWPMLQLPADATKFPPNGARVSAVDKFLGHSRFSGDQGDPIHDFKIGQTTRLGNAHISYLQIISMVFLKDIPKALYPPAYTVPVAEKDVALWVRYRCGIKGQNMSGWYGGPIDGGDRGATPGACSGSAPGVFDRIEIELKGPYAQFFDFSTKCVKGNEGEKPCKDEGGFIEQLTVTMKPKHTFHELLFDKHLSAP